MEKAYINYSNQKELDKPIYRIFTIQRLLEVFGENALTLVKPSKWDDPFENFLMKAKGVLPDGTQFSVASREHFYGQCWTNKRETDALWRIYAPDKNGVRVRTTPRKLLTALLTQNPQTNGVNLTCFIGKVEYFKKDVLEGFFRVLPDLLTDKAGVGLAKTLLLKRTEFEHEDEVRILFNSLKDSAEDLYKVSIDPFTFFDGIVFDPRMNYTMFKIFKAHFKKLGFSNHILKSTLYKEPEYTFDFSK